MSMKNLSYFIILFMLLSCSAGKFTTTNFHNLAGFEENSHIYALPKTRIVVHVEVEKTEITPGPYHQYAKKYLGIEGVPTVSSNRFEIKDISISTQSVTDPDYIFSVKNENFANLEQVLEDYRSKGLIMQEGASAYYNKSLEMQDKPEEIYFTDLSIKPFYHTTNRKNATGNQFINVPIHSKQNSLKTTEEKAAEAAKFLFKLRKRRFKLLAGQYEVFPEGVALESAVKELDNLEAEYLSLFIGKQHLQTLSSRYTFTPSENEEIQRFTMFRFDENSGLHPSSGQDGEAIILQVTDLNTNVTLSNINRSNTQEATNIIYLRFADRAKVKVFYGSHEVVEAEIPIYQFGVHIPKYVPAAN